MLGDLLMLGFIVKAKSVDRLGPMEMQALVDAIREQLQQHLRPLKIVGRDGDERKTCGL